MTKKPNLLEFFGKAGFEAGPVSDAELEFSSYDDENFNAAELLAREFQGVGWDYKEPADSDWRAAGNLYPSAGPTVAASPVPPPGVVIPQRETPLSLFDKTYDAEERDAAITRSATFEMITGRFDPFEDDRMRSMLEGSHYSTFLNRPVLNFRDALDHSIQLCRFWSEEDEQTAAMRKAEEEQKVEEAKPGWTPPPPVLNEQAERVENARVAWKTAVAQRNKAIKEWDAYVMEFRLRYQFEKKNRVQHPL
jgi:hypothetical protein